MRPVMQRQGQPLPEAVVSRILEDDRRFLLHSWSAQKSRRATIIAGGQGAVFWDAEGKRYLDFASQLVNLNLGFGHPRVVEAIQAQAAELCYVAPEFANAQRGRKFGRLCAIINHSIRLQEAHAAFHRRSMQTGRRLTTNSVALRRLCL